MKSTENTSTRARRSPSRTLLRGLCCTGLLGALASPAWAEPAPATMRLAMGPNPGGRLGEDMPFEGDDVIRRAPAATKERDTGKPSATKTPPAAANAPCKNSTPGAGKEPECSAPPKEEPPTKR